MKKLLVLAIALTVSVMAKAQFSVQAGFLMNTTQTTLTTTHYNGVELFADYNINLGGNFGIAPGFGLEYNFTNNYGARYREVSLMLPIDLNISFPINNGINLAIFAGPTLHYGLLSKDFATNPAYDYYLNDNKHFDMTLGGGIWCDIREAIRVKIGYKWGVLNSSKIANINERTNTLALSVGYIF